MVAFHAVVLAAGQGTRMKSALPKVLHPLAGLPLVAHVMNAAAAAGAHRCSAVIPPESKGFEQLHTPVETRFFEQKDRLGTAHAVLMARPALQDETGPVLILYGDTPLVTPASLKALASALQDGAGMAVMGFNAKDPKGYGRFITADNGELLAIREEKDATLEERGISLCNSGIMAFQGNIVLGLLDRIDNKNKAGEYYLTDAVEIARAAGHRVAYALIGEDEVRGVNTRAQLSEAEAILQDRLRLRAMEGGATLISPSTATFSHDTIIGQDVLIEPNVFFGPGTVIGDGVTIKAFSHIEGAYIESGVTIGPFARLRPGTRLGPGVRIGNFVELKAADLKAGVKVNHLSYIGDAGIGEDANIGAGTITCNYDGFHKHKTEIGARAFIGSNSALVAPVRIGEGAYVGSGSVIGRDVPDHALALTRAPQVNREDWARRTRARHESAQANGRAPEHQEGGAGEAPHAASIGKDTD
ncbi:MAG: bifunctional UDP-N-acetylglucosamine diphosphorylase/glucosamine-1-phosphate N-acetyltransferase GlmU, partial [Rhodomicrobium sp.]|nr:bifunctional UDP-N-acetylglucosamine diphosphorylase/glucosamine-1-phosphate N-acetyltransferase GlmU [Rhodomicrobium sp.]